MRKLLFVLLLIVPLCFSSCSKRQENGLGKENSSTANSAQYQPSSGEEGTKKGANSATKVPATGSNISISEPMSEEALASFESLQSVLNEKEAFCGIAFIGKNETAKSIAECIEEKDILSKAGYGDRYPFMKELTASCCSSKMFDEIFCLVPQTTVRSVSIRESGKSGEKSILYSAENSSPLYFSAKSGGKDKSNIIVRVELKDSSIMEFSPYLDSDGILHANQGVFDFSLPMTK